MEKEKQTKKNEGKPIREVKFKGEIPVEGEEGLINKLVEVDGKTWKIRRSVDDETPQAEDSESGS